MSRFAPYLGALLLFACDGKSDTGTTTGSATGAATGSATGTATGGTGTGTGTGSTTDVFTVSIVSPSQSCDPTSTATDLDLTGASERIAVLHYGVIGEVCAAWEVSAVATRSTSTIDVTYTNTNTITCGTTTCPFTVQYILNDIPEGTWTVNADDDSATVLVLP